MGSRRDDPVVRYRPDIDGLRAVAVLGVLFYHLGIGSVPGGFAGVDVFFVISGFLITQLIREELRMTGTLDMGRFYLRRLRRLFPALFLAVAAVIVCGAVLFLPDQFERLGGAALHALFSVSNFFFWAESGYFDPDARFKPLLHTWSLGVEAQFYLVWPVVLVTLYRKMGEKAVIAFLALAAVGSLGLNHVFVDGHSTLLSRVAPGQAQWFADGKATIFYLLPFRVFEFAIGAGLVWIADIPSRGRSWLHDAMLVVGLGLIGFAFAAFSSAEPWPYFGALVPCIGTALVILAGRPKILGPALTNPVMTSIGQISYSLYLVHWPIIVFVQHVSLAPLTASAQSAIAVASVGLAALIYRLVEKPLRKPKSPAALSPAGFSLACAAAVLVLVLPLASIWSTNGWAWRHDVLIDDQTVEDYKSARFVETVNACGLVEFASGTSGRRADGQLRCKADADAQIVVMGDSHAVDGLNTFAELYRGRSDVNIVYALKDGGDDVCMFRADAAGRIGHDLNRAGCEQRAAAMNSDVWSRVDLIVLDAFGDQPRQYDIAAAIANRHPHLKVLILGPYIGTRPYNCSDLANRFMTFDACRTEQFVSVFGADPSYRTRLPEGRHVFVDRRIFFCDETLELQTCAVTLGANPVFVDGDHLTLEASRYIAGLMKAGRPAHLASSGILP